MSILVAGGAGYIGSHTCVSLLEAGCEIIVADNLSNSCEESLRRVEQITGKEVPFVKVELCDPEATRDGTGVRDYIHVVDLAEGHVARGVCVEDENNFLLTVTERTHIEKDGDNARFTEDDGATWTALPGDTIVSMNLWGLTRSFIEEAETRFPAFLDNALAENPLKGEYFLPSVISQLIEEHKARVKVLRSGDKWYGVTYQADKPMVVAALAEKTTSGLYPADLWA